MEYGVSLNGIHSFKDLNLLFKEMKDSGPSVKTIEVDIPCGHGSADITESVTGSVMYGNRQLEISLIDPEIGNEVAKEQNIMNLFHGKIIKIILDDNENYYYQGRCEVSCYATGRDIVIKCNAKPFKYALEDTVIEVEPGEDIEVNIDIIGVNVIPVLITEGNVTVTAGNNIYNYSSGEHIAVNLELVQGTNEFKITSEVGCLISYREALL